MKIFPFDRFTMETELSPEQVRAALDENIVECSFDLFGSLFTDCLGGYT